MNALITSALALSFAVASVSAHAHDRDERRECRRGCVTKVCSLKKAETYPYAYGVVLRLVGPEGRDLQEPVYIAQNLSEGTAIQILSSAACQ